MNRRLTLKDLGAEHCVNLLEPVKCDCGCNRYVDIIIGDTEEDNVLTFAETLLEDVDCNHAWIFIIEDWAISGAYTTLNDYDEQIVQYFTTAVGDTVFDFEQQVEFAKAIIEKIEPHCIGVLQHTEDGCFRVVTEDAYDSWIVKGVKLKRKRRPNTYFS